MGQDLVLRDERYKDNDTIIIFLSNMQESYSIMDSITQHICNRTKTIS